MADVQPKRSSAFLLDARPGQWTRYWPNTPKSTCNVYSTPQGLSAPPIASSIAIYHCAGNKLLMLFCLADVEYGECNESKSSHEGVCGVVRVLSPAGVGHGCETCSSCQTLVQGCLAWRNGVEGKRLFGGGVQPSVTGRQPDRGAAARTLKAERSRLQR